MLRTAIQRHGTFSPFVHGLFFVLCAGNTRTAIICCVSPAEPFQDETRSTLQFASRAKTITTTCSPNESLADEVRILRLEKDLYKVRSRPLVSCLENGWEEQRVDIVTAWRFCLVL